ncbi:hypothetical protein LOAG_04089 [Loa loa]|uniref:Uncharacterized protein n=1 Tax=Loa loa TaxID=7209 RepID=A0A1I7V597_LOALO|nr:hypothetical protein LOAG_04089 [Loa loa]EFO24392.1 hypothetical protein LOAG_04089 [Loa loa]
MRLPAQFDDTNYQSYGKFSSISIIGITSDYSQTIPYCDQTIVGIKVVLIVLIFVGIINADVDSGRRGEGGDFFECHGERGKKKGCAAIVTFPSFCEPANLTGGEMM